jgi:short-subunit dehydrogenase
MRLAFRRRPAAVSPGLPSPSAEFTALVTGASSGIGAEFARALARRGHSLTLVARRTERLRELAGELSRAHGVRVDWVSADLGDAAQRERLHAEVLALGRPVQVLVNSAGFGIYMPFVMSAREHELEQVRLLVEAVVDLDARFVPAMVRRGHGAVVNVGSTAGFQALPGNGTYSASKAFVLTHSEALAEELRGTGVNVTAVCPGPVPTEFFAVGQPLIVNRIPRAFWCSAPRVAEDGRRAVGRGATSVVPGSLLVRAFYGPCRTAPRRIVAPIARWLMAGELERMRDIRVESEPELERPPGGVKRAHRSEGVARGQPSEDGEHGQPSESVEHRQSSGDGKAEQSPEAVEVASP